MAFSSLQISLPFSSFSLLSTTFLSPLSRSNLHISSSSLLSTASPFTFLGFYMSLFPSQLLHLQYWKKILSSKVAQKLFIIVD
uniref:Uncharacterized protein n=1 Tax=Solanum lycopersicum TaxID=4081 RepID=A0A3Q7J5X5_SOLLC